MPYYLQLYVIISIHVCPVKVVRKGTLKILVFSLPFWIKSSSVVFHE